MKRTMNRSLANTFAAAALCSLFTPAMADEATTLSCASGPLTNASSVEEFSLKTPLAIVGLTSDGQLVCASDRKPEKARVIGTVSGYASPDTKLIGIDFRAQDGLLYGVGDGGGLYRINTDNAALTPIGKLTVAPSGTKFGVDFNPAANALRIVSDNGQNLRQPFGNLGTANPLAATANDSMLSYVAPPAAPVAAMGVVGAAYTNNDVSGITATSLFVLDANLKQVALQSPANTGLLVATGMLGVTPTDGGFDIYSVLRNNVTVDQRALAVLTVGGVAGLYDISVLTGKASLRGSFIGNVVDIAAPLNQY